MNAQSENPCNQRRMSTKVERNRCALHYLRANSPCPLDWMLRDGLGAD